MSEEEVLNSIAKWAYLFILLIGIAFYVSWSFMYNAWTDLGVYGVTIVLVSFGFFGTILYWKKN